MNKCRANNTTAFCFSYSEWPDIQTHNFEIPESIENLNVTMFKNELRNYNAQEKNAKFMLTHQYILNSKEFLDPKV